MTVCRRKVNETTLANVIVGDVFRYWEDLYIKTDRKEDSSFTLCVRLRDGAVDSVSNGAYVCKVKGTFEYE